MSFMKRTLVAAIAVVGLATGAQAAVINSNSIASPTTIDFSQFVAAPISNAPGPIQVGGLVGEDVELNGNPDDGLYAWNSGWGLISNGGWDGGRNGYVGANNGRPGSLIFNFNDGPVAQVGAFINHAPDRGADLIIRVFSAANLLLEEYNITANDPILTPGGQNEGAFFGFARDTADIASFEIFGYVPVADDLAFSRDAPNVVPLPAALPLMAGSLGLLFVGRLRRRQQPS